MNLTKSNSTMPQQQSAIAEITASLMAIGVAPAEAHERAVGCVCMADPSLFELASLHVAERLWQEEMGDESTLRSFVAFASSGVGACDRALKILRSVQSAWHLYQGFYMRPKDHDLDRVRAAGSLTALKQIVKEHDRTLGDKAKERNTAPVITGPWGAGR